MSDPVFHLSPPNPVTQEMMFDGWLDGKRHIYPLLAQYEDTDAGGIVYHSNYINYAERGRSACLRCYGVDLAHYIAAHQQTFVIRHIDISYAQPARLSDKLHVVSRMVKAGAASGVLEQIVQSAEDGHIFARLLVQAAWVSLETGPVRFPPELRKIIAAMRDDDA